MQRIMYSITIIIRFNRVSLKRIFNNIRKKYVLLKRFILKIGFNINEIIYLQTFFVCKVKFSFRGSKILLGYIFFFFWILWMIMKLDHSLQLSQKKVNYSNSLNMRDM